MNFNRIMIPHDYLDKEDTEHVASFRYLGSVITEDLDPDRKVKCRIESARAVFNKMNIKPLQKMRHMLRLIRPPGWNDGLDP